MACRMQKKNPIQLNFTFPENGCRSDVTLYYHPAVGQQRSIFSCDWDERKETYDCNNLEAGVTWYRPHSKHAIITLPEHFEQISEYFRYQTLCYGQRQEIMCLWAPADKKTADHTMRAEAVSNTTSIGTEYTVQKGSNQFGNQGNIVLAVIPFFVVTIILIIMVFIAIFLLYKKIKGVNKKLQHVINNKKNENGVESQTEVEPSYPISMERESNAALCTEVESVVSTTSEPDTDMDTDVKNQSLESDFGEEILKNKKNENRLESEIEAEESVPLLPNKKVQYDVMKSQMEMAIQSLDIESSTEPKDPLSEPEMI